MTLTSLEPGMTSSAVRICVVLAPMCQNFVSSGVNLSTRRTCTAVATSARVVGGSYVWSRVSSGNWEDDMPPRIRAGSCHLICIRLPEGIPRGPDSCLDLFLIGFLAAVSLGFDCLEHPS